MNISRIYARLLLVLLFALSIVQGWAQQDTLLIIGEVRRHDTTDELRIFRDFHWNARVHHPDGRVTHYSGARIDTVLEDATIDTVSLHTFISVADSNQAKLLYMRYAVSGSLLGSVDGKVFANTGYFGRSREERHFNQKGYAALFFAGPTADIDIEFIADRSHEFEVALALVGKDVGEIALSQLNEKDQSSYARGFYYLAFGIVFILLFGFRREKREHLYFALFCIFAAVAYLWEYLHCDSLTDMHRFFGLLCFEFLAIFFSRLLLNKERSKVPLYLILTLLFIGLFPLVRGFMVNTNGGRSSLYVMIVVTVFYPYSLFSSLVFLIKGLGQKSWEARAIIFTCFVPLVIYVLLSLSVFVFFAADTQSAVQEKDFYRRLINGFLTAIIYIYPLGPVLILARRNALNQKQLAEQLDSIQHLSEENVAKEKEKKEILERQNERLEREVRERTAEITDQKAKIERQHDELKIEKEKADDLLRNILPAEVAEELKETGSAAARHFESVTVLFADFVDFTITGSELTPQALVHELDVCFRAFDAIMAERGIEKIKTIGDAYLAVCGLPLPDADHAIKITSAAKAILEFMEQRRKDPIHKMVDVRIGIHTGSVVAGIVGVKKFAYDIWGDTVNTAARMQQASDPGKINISKATHDMVSGSYQCTPRGLIEVKGKGEMEMYFVN
jgi:adenylate cyclase